MKVLAIMGGIFLSASSLAQDATLFDGFCKSIDVDVAEREFVDGRHKLRVLTNAEPTECSVRNEVETIHVEFSYEYSIEVADGPRRYYTTSPLRLQVDWGQTVQYIYTSRGPIKLEDVFVKRCYAVGQSRRVYGECGGIQN